ncbi:hypothetical protein [Actinomadura nitritigenes]|uniref:hypothetical protein n=1 Tax=Actinomadura nitritigenes TaxID=134602 RepID=UPI003D8D7529
MSARMNAERVAELEAEVETLRTAVGTLQQLVNALYEDGAAALKARADEQAHRAAEVADRRASLRLVAGGRS